MSDGRQNAVIEALVTMIAENPHMAHRGESYPLTSTELPPKLVAAHVRSVVKRAVARSDG